MSHPSAPTSLDKLLDFRFEKVINEDPVTHSLTLLGTFPDRTVDSSAAEGGARVQAVVRIEKTALSSGLAERLLARREDGGLLDRIVVEESTDIYTWLFGWLNDDRERDVKINIVCPATEVHIRKYMKQNLVMVRETPALYERIVKPYIDAFPASRTKWVENILNGASEQNKVLFSSAEFLILPDMKWDLMTVSSLYLIALVQDRTIRSLRDLRKKHLGLLTEIRDAAQQVVKEKWALGKGALRLYVHYQPSYYHFHVHIVNANHVGLLGMAAGQAHLLDDVISLLEIDKEEGPGIFEKMTLTYTLGDQHGLFEAMHTASE